MEGKSYPINYVILTGQFDKLPPINNLQSVNLIINDQLLGWNL